MGFWGLIKKLGDIDVHTHYDNDGEEDGSVYSLPRSYKRLIPDDENDEIVCPVCGSEEIYYRKGEYVCIYCENTFSKDEIEEANGASFYHA